MIPIYYIFSLMWFTLGFVVSLFAFAQIILPLLFAIPFTNYLDHLGAIKKKGKIIRRYLLTILIYIVIILILVKLVLTYLNQEYTIALSIGVLLSILNLLKPSSWGMTPGNVREYVKINNKYFKEESFVMSILSDEIKEVYFEKNFTSENPMMVTLAALHERHKS